MASGIAVGVAPVVSTLVGYCTVRSLSLFRRAQVQSNRARLRADAAADIDAVAAAAAAAAEAAEVEMRLADYGLVFVLYSVVLLACSLSFPAEVLFWKTGWRRKRKKKAMMIMG